MVNSTSTSNSNNFDTDLLPEQCNIATITIYARALEPNLWILFDNVINQVDLDKEKNIIHRIEYANTKKSKIIPIS